MYVILLGGFRLEIYRYMVSRLCVHHCFWLVIYRYCVKVVYPVSNICFTDVVTMC